MKGNIIILSAPSGTGKSSIIKHLMKTRPDLDLHFSISATNRSPRKGEQHEREYYFLSDEEFRSKVEAGEFVEWQEVYDDTYYGTLMSEVKRVVDAGHTLIMDIDVMGSLDLKKRFGDDALSIFILPPSIQELEKRLHNRGTDSDDVVAMRLAKAGYEMTFAPQFDCVVVNDEFDKAAEDVADKIEAFIKK
ncbi:MAG: guanylate kinase [Muribaculaceae bacterium]|nr:guanylate kinase [Muribaculaceae bacterium]